MIKKTALAIAITLGLTGCQGHDTGTTKLPKPTTSTHTTITHKLVINNCEDSPKTPCITWDEEQWRLVTSYDPYTMRVLVACRPRVRTDCVQANNRHYVIVKIDGKIYHVR